MSGCVLPFLQVVEGGSRKDTHPARGEAETTSFFSRGGACLPFAERHISVFLGGGRGPNGDAHRSFDPQNTLRKRVSGLRWGGACFLELVLGTNQN